MSGFQPEFAKYQVVISNYQGDPWPEATKTALMDYVQDGGGLVIYHFALAAFPDWQQYNEMIGLGGWGGRNEKWGPYVRWRDGKIVRDNSPGKCGRMGRAGVPTRRPRAESSHHGGPAAGVHARAGRTVRLAAWPGEGPYRAGHGLRAQGQGRRRRARAAVVHHPVRQGPGVPERLGHSAEELKSVAFIVTFQRGVEWAATGKVTQKVPADFPTADKASVRE